jgi:hypothetical protein
LGCLIIPEDGDPMWIPSCDTVNLLIRRRYRNFEDSAESGKPTKADSLRLGDLLGMFSVASEVKHVQCKGGARPNSYGDTLEEDEDSNGVAVMCVSLLKIGPNPLVTQVLDVLVE